MQEKAREFLDLNGLGNDLTLLRWNKELPAASSQDPLGLNLRVSARLTAELLHCITSITPRARYFAFFPWAIQDYRDREENKPGDRGFSIGVVTRERAMVLGAVLHHEGHACDGGSLGGSNKAVDVVNESPWAEFNLEKWQHLKSPQGQLSAAYIASLVNLGLFEMSEDEIGDDVAQEKNELEQEQTALNYSLLSDRGKRLAGAFGSAVGRTKYVQNGSSCSSVVDRDVLRDFGSQAGLCEIGNPNAIDREILREILFSCGRQDIESGHHRRRMTLLLLLECARICEANGTDLDEDKFADLIYYRGSSEILRTTNEFVLGELDDIAHRWRIFCFQGHFSLALQAILVAIVRSLRHKEGGLDKTQLMDAQDGGAISRRLSDLVGHDHEGDFFDLTARETLDKIGWSVEFSEKVSGETAVSCGINERNAEAELAHLLLNEDEANGAAGFGLAAILLYVVISRYSAENGGNYDVWYRNHVMDQSSDLSLPTFLDWLGAGDGNWLDRVNRQLLEEITWKFLVIQHQKMSYDRGFGGSSSLFNLDGTTVIETGLDYVDPRPLNARLPSALQILVDLGFLEQIEKSWRLTSDGRQWLEVQLAHEAKR